MADVNIEILLDEDADKDQRRKGSLKPSHRRQYPARRRLQKEQFWDLYDLGTRLQNVDTPGDWMTGVRAIDDHSAVPTDASKTLQYVEILFDAPASISQLNGSGVPQGHRDVYSFDPGQDVSFFNQYIGADHVQVAPDDLSVIAGWDARLLGIGDAVDPFGTTKLDHADAGEIPNCMPLKFSGSYPIDIYPTDQFTLEAYDPAENPQQPRTDVNIYGDKRWQNADTRAVAPDPNVPGDTGTPAVTERRSWENWNPLNLVQRALDFGSFRNVDVNIFERGRFNMGKIANEQPADKLHAGTVQLRLTSKTTAYEPFDTGDRTNYKITTGPSYAAAEADFSTTNDTPMKFWLKPQWLGMFRQFAFSGSVGVSYETYRNGPVNGWPNFRNGWGFIGQVDQFGNLVHPPRFSKNSQFPDPIFSLNVNVDLSDPDGPVGNGTATISANTVTGAFDISGLPGGSVSGNATYFNSGGIHGWSIDAIISGYHVQGGWTDAITVPFADSYYAGNIVDSCNYQTNWYGVGVQYNTPSSAHLTGAGFSGRGLMGAHIGRRPAFPRILGLAIFRVIDINGTTNFTFTYSDGTQKQYSAAQAAAYKGTQESIAFMTDDPMRPVYARHAGRDGHCLVTKSLDGFLNIYPVSGQTMQVINLTAPAVGTIASPAALSSAIQAAFDGFYASVVSAFAARPDTRNVLINRTGPGLAGSGPMFGVQIDAEAGALCAVIEKGGKKYYIWRKTREIRSGYDYDRQSFRANYNTQILP